MQIGLVTDSVPALSTTEALDLAAELGLDTVEFATGNWSTAPHAELDHHVLAAGDHRDPAGPVGHRHPVLARPGRVRPPAERAAGPGNAR